MRCFRALDSFSRREFCGALGSMALLGALGCGDTRRRKRPNVVLVVLDTVRTDHTSGWGYRRPTTPNLDGFLLESAKFNRALAPAPWTLPSHASMFTGKYPFMTGVHTYLVEKDGKEDLAEPPLDDGFHTLAEVLRGEGYATAAFVANSVYLTPKFNLQQGFDVYEVNRVPAAELTPPALRWLDGQKSKPFFLFMNIMDAHYPINTTPRPGVVEGPVSQDPDLTKRAIEATMPQQAPPAPAILEALVAQYDTGIANADVGVGMVLDYLKKSGLYDDTILIVTSDHGEFLGERDYVGHSKDIYQQTVSVPLAVRLPRQRAGETIDRFTPLTDIPGIVLGAAFGVESLPRFEEFMKGNSGSFPVLAENYYSRRWDIFDARWGHRFRRVRTAIFRWPWKYIASSDGHDELYHLGDDPRETDNRLERDAVVASALRKTLAKVKPAAAGSAPTVTREMTEEEKDEMRALGYL